MRSYRVVIEKDTMIFSSVTLLAFISTLSNVRYLRMLFPPVRLLSIISLCIATFLSVVFSISHRKYFENKILLCFVYFAYTSAITLINKSSLSELISQLGPTICFCILFTGIKRKSVLLSVLNTLRICLIVMLILDALSMLVFPNGLYFGDNRDYDKCWFLGFKTERLYYLLPLLIISTYLFFMRDVYGRRKAKVQLIVLLGLVLIVTVKSKATAGIIAILFYALIVLLIRINDVNGYGILSKITGGIISVVSNFYTFLVVSIVSFLTIVLTQNNSLLIDAIISLTRKTATFSGRTRIWTYTLRYISDHLIFGTGVMNVAQYQEITYGFNNPHNIMLSYLATGGIIGLSMMLFMVYICYKTIGKDFIKIIPVMGIVDFFILGTASSALAFCPFFFSLFIMVMKGKYLE